MHLQALKRSLHLRDSQLVGCTRKNRLDQTPPGWRYLRGNALLSHLGYKVHGKTPVDEFDVFLGASSPVIYTFRGGPWRSWWNEDITLLLALSKLYVNEGIEGAIVLHELDNDVKEVYVNAPSLEESSTLVQQALNRWRDHSRIPKNGARSLATCKYCPVKRQCDALDLENNDINDWPSDYQVG